MNETKKIRVFSCNGEELPLNEIQKKKIISVTIRYLSEIKKKRSPGLIGKLGFVKLSQEKREVTITDNQGIILFLVTGDSFASINFSDKGEWGKVNDCDDRTLFKRDLQTVRFRYQLNFHPDNLINVVWE